MTSSAPSGIEARQEDRREGLLGLAGPPHPSRRQRLGLLLAAFGATGLVPLVAGLLLVVAPVDEAEGFLGIEGHRREVVELLVASAAAVETAATAARDADDSLGSTATAAGSAGAMMDELAGSMRELAGSLRVSILGSQPFAPAADDMDRVAARAGTVATDLDAAAASVRLAEADLTDLAAQLDGLAGDLEAIRLRLAAPADTGPLRLLLGLLLGWLAVPALVSVAIGIRWLRPAPGWRQPRPPAPR